MIAAGIKVGGAGEDEAEKEKEKKKPDTRRRGGRGKVSAGSCGYPSFLCVPCNADPVLVLGRRGEGSGRGG
jgi:hypothetical protein